MHAEQQTKSSPTENSYMQNALPKKTWAKLMIQHGTVDNHGSSQKTELIQEQSNEDYQNLKGLDEKDVSYLTKNQSMMSNTIGDTRDYWLARK